MCPGLAPSSGQVKQSDNKSLANVIDKEEEYNFKF